MMEFDTERFIVEIEARPAIWNFTSPAYSNKHQKYEAWEDLCAVMIPGYEEMEVAVKAYKCKILQRKWRSLRDCYARELNAQIQQKSGSARVDRKQYMYFNQLSFLRQSVGKRKTKSSMDEDQNEVVDSEQTAIQDDAIANVIQISPQPTPRPKTLSQPVANFSILPATVTSRKRSQEQVASRDLKVPQGISKRFCPSQQGHTKKAEDDEDRLFLLSLLKDVKKVNEDDKLELKSEMILLIKKWQNARQPKHQLTTFSNNSQFNKGTTNSQGNNDSYEFSGQTSNQQYPNPTSSGMSSSTGRMSPGSQRSTVQSPPLLQISTVQSPNFCETSCESSLSNCSEYYQ